ncbi:efflux transporter periplasmic adaptor subunit [Methylovirgula ligni]|uniref:RND family efflux transporter MFP subunit n=1 Tax=Methylovirgula ligni TaxID=569860 RepID=A0A3D9Z573_9HYPH|nr:efflux RND transporter periplasmic adaptor subunit [Methylovirgula ligni]QAY96019.1 efflux transporter periplasmic adaptor subunit [Methylovirgula ligni]REF86309.1 RND family efflux transporter MFP subunit [Methylovirgula ligni]
MLEKTDNVKPDAAPHTAPETEPSAPLQRGSGGKLLILLALAVLLGGIYFGIRARTTAEAALSQETVEAAVPIVEVVQPKADAPDQALVLPGQTTAFTDTPIYARANGYLKKWYVDIGAQVKKGELLAEIETPELDAQLRQARADLVTAEANAKLASITANRTEDLLKSNSVSTQERDNAAGASAADKAIVTSRQADVARLEELQSYEKIYAPFDGVITARNTDLGDLITAGAGTRNSELFHMQATGTLRIYVAIPEIYAPQIHVGAKPSVTLDEYPGQSFEGTLVRTDKAINQLSRTLLAEVDVDNATDKILPGAYTFVHFALRPHAGSVTIPANTLLFRSEGLRVGIVRDGKVELVPISIGRDYGDRVEVLSGLKSTDQVIVNPSDSLISGVTVRVNASKPAGAS